METIKVTGCTDCPFCQVEWYPDSVGNDMLLSCGLVKYVKDGFQEFMIACYDSYEEEQEPIETPEWCPLTEIQITKL